MTHNAEKNVDNQLPFQFANLYRRTCHVFLLHDNLWMHKNELTNLTPTNENQTYKRKSKSISD